RRHGGGSARAGCLVAPKLSTMQGETVLGEAVEAYRAALGDRLLGAYALGSLAHGGFSELVSDVDLGLIIGDPPQPSDPEAIARVLEAERRKRSPLHRSEEHTSELQSRSDL